jgi:sensor c-di-GMP phosphodiesterase-like protein
MPDSTLPSLRQRLLVPLAITLTAASLGMLAGLTLGRDLSLNRAGGRLNLYAAHVLNEVEASADESHSVLAAMNASPFSFCSDAEIAYMRKLIFQSVFLKEGGRMRDGTIGCSATLGRLNDAQVPIRPDFARSDGTRLYKNLSPFLIAGQTVISVQLGDSFVVYSPYNVRGLTSPPMHYTVTNLDSSHPHGMRIFGGTPETDGAILTQEGQQHIGNTLYSTRCSTRYGHCMTAYMSVPDALGMTRSEILLCSASGGLAGAILGFLCTWIYRRNRSMVHQLRRAIAKDKLRVVYQPIVSLATEQIVGAEALVRWTNEAGIPVGPDVFVKVAEERGFVGSITRLVLRRILQDFSQTMRSNPNFRVSINASASDLADPGFPPMLEQSLNRAGVAARSLAIEITETSTARYKIARETILSLRKMGHSVHIDDFGTGYSSLSYLHDLSVDAIKIDKSFTQAVGTDSVILAILPQILSMAAALNLDVIVEGVETAEQARYFAASPRAILAQGWRFGRPMLAEQFHRLLAERAASAMLLLPAGDLPGDIVDEQPGERLDGDACLPEPEVAEGFSYQ